MSEGVLDDVKVLDLSQDIAGSFCARLMGDYGAEVIKVEPPEGAALRRAGPFHQDDPHPEKSLFFFVLNLNKMGITLNLESEGGRQIFKRLAADVDVVVESFKPGYLNSLDLGYEVLEGLNPRLVMTSVTPFGQTGPYSEYEGEEIVSYAMGAIMSISGTRDWEPLKHSGFQAQYEGGLNGAAATSIALFSQSLTGQGQHLDVSTAEGVASTMIASLTRYAFTGGIETRRPPRGTSFRHPMPCKDGWVIAQNRGSSNWQAVADFFGTPDLLEPRLAEAAARGEPSEERDALILEGIKDRGKWELFHEVAGHHLLFGVVQTPEELAHCPQLKARGFFREVEHPVMGRVRVPAVLFDMSHTPYQLHRPAPMLGEHNQEVYCGRLGYTPEELSRLWQMSVV